MKKLPILFSILLISFFNKLYSQFKSDDDLIGTWVSKDLKKGAKWIFMEHNLLLQVDSNGKEQTAAYHLDTLKKDLWVINQLPGADSIRTLLYFKIIKESKNSFDIFLYKGSIIHSARGKENEDIDCTNKNFGASFQRLY